MKNPVPGGQDHWLQYILVDDVGSSTHKARSLGGTVVKGVTEVPNMGWLSVVVDPAGAVFALRQAKAVM